MLLLLWHHDAECGYYASFNFGIKPVIEWYRVFVLQLSLLAVFIGSILEFFLILTKNINYRAKVRKLLRFAFLAFFNVT